MSVLDNEIWHCVRRGREPKFRQPEELAVGLEDYFNNTPEEKWTITGIVKVLGGSWDTFRNYSKKPEFADLIKYARLLVEGSYEQSLRSPSSSGAKFALTNINSEQWKEKTESKQTLEVTQMPQATIGGEELVLDIGEDVKLIEGGDDTSS